MFVALLTVVPAGKVYYDWMTQPTLKDVQRTDTTPAREGIEAIKARLSKTDKERRDELLGRYPYGYVLYWMDTGIRELVMQGNPGPSIRTPSGREYAINWSGARLVVDGDRTNIVLPDVADLAHGSETLGFALNIPKFTRGPVVLPPLLIGDLSIRAEILEDVGNAHIVVVGAGPGTTGK
jgi:hypothetical protein